MQLINIQKQKINQQETNAVSARELHKFLEASERFSAWFERMCQYGFEEHQDFTGVKSFTVVNNGAEKPLVDFLISIDMAKEISMLQRSEKGKQARRYFIECEKQLTSRLPTSYRDAIAQLLIEIDAKEEAIRTKAEIGSKREATAMATASNATKQRNSMAITVDKHHEWASVLRVQQVTGKKYNWKPLKEYCLAHNIPIKKVDSGMDTRFAQVNTYHKDAWFECFSVDITEFK